ncbi:MAG: OmpA family protein, partial [Paludibacteraceae bacterium]|nr:OmpA family protein [Paludibacteraceae bacterium]
GLYGGLYVNYGFTDILDTRSDKKLFSPEGVYTTMLESDQITKVGTIAAGFKMAVTLPTDRVKKKHEMPENKEIPAQEPMIAPEVKRALLSRDSIHHLPDSLIYIRYSREEVAKVKNMISQLGEIENVTEEKKVKYRNTITAYDTLTSFEKLDITWNERRHLKFAEYALNAEDAIKMLSEEMSTMFTFPFNESGFTSTEDMEVAFEDMKVLLRLQPNKGLLIKGHADKVEMDHNDAIGIERAFFIRDILKDKGTAADQLDVKDMKDKEPVDVSGTDEGKAKNRRVTFSIYEQ